jgi:adenylate kinase family enzyme
MLREEVEAQTPLGREVADIMSSGGLVSSAVVTALMRRRMRQHPGRRILLDGFPRSLENARDFVELCGPPELALHLDCDDCILLERILERGGKSAKEAERAAVEGRGRTVNVRADDNVHTAIQRLKNYHKHHKPTMDWLKSIKVPIVELDCSGTKEDVWQQLMAIGRLMRPAVKIPPVGQIQQQQSQDLQWFA